MIQILIVDDEKPICDLIQMSLTRAGYHCMCVYDGLAAADILERNVFDLILLDVMLPNADGFELMEYIRPLGIPVIFLTARGSVDDRVRGLRMGAEDYIVKPFEVVELLARVDVVLRRYNKTDAVIEIGGLRIDTRAHRVHRAGRPRRDGHPGAGKAHFRHCDLRRGGKLLHRGRCPAARMAAPPAQRPARRARRGERRIWRR